MGSLKNLEKKLYDDKIKSYDFSGYKDAKVMVDQLLADVLDILIPHLYCDKCGENPKEHTMKIEHNMNYYDENKNYLNPAFLILCLDRF